MSNTKARKLSQPPCLVRIVRRLYRFARWETHRGLLLEAAFWLTVFVAARKSLPFPKLAKLMGEPGLETAQETPPDEDAAARDIGRMIQRLASFIPGSGNCLVQALTAQRMLKRRGFASTLYVGTAMTESREFRAHAWLRCGELLVTGGAGHEQYSVISKYATHESHRLLSKEPG